MVEQGSAQRPGGRDYFSLFQLPAQQSLDIADLTRRFHLLQKRFHPDNAQSGSAAEQRLAAQLSAEINTAYQVLKDPIRRAGYLLECAGVELPALERRPVDMAFLQQQILWREQVQEAEAEELQALTVEIDALLATTLDEVSPALSEGELDRAGDAWLRALYLKKLRFELAEQLERKDY